MAKSRPSVQKRAKEAARIEKRRSKAQRQERRKTEKEERPDLAEADVDPDIAGIVPGPQPPLPEFEELEED